jgi:GTP cyclohydrolase I
MKDIQRRKDKRGIPIKEVGISEIFLPISVSDKKNKLQQVISRIKISTNLSPEKRGTHLSRFLEVINKYQAYNFDIAKIADILKEVKSKLKTPEANLEISFIYFIEKIAPVSKNKFLMDYRCKIIGRILKNDRIFKKLEVEVPISSVCPCSKEISRVGAHNQRGLIILNVTISEFIWLEDLINLVESEASGILYPILKRPDEKYVTEKMFDNPKLVEDIVRDIAISVKEDKRIIDFSVKCINYESIHNHNVYAEITNRK